jgi:hypothetical protein
VKYIKRAACLAIALATLAACGAKDPQTTKTVADLAIKRRLAEIAGQANGAAPAVVDEHTRLDGAKAGPGLKLTTMYTLTNPDATGINKDTFEAKLTPVVKEGGCKNPDLRPLIDRGVVVVLEYRSIDGSPIGTVSINRDTCVAIK